MNKGRVSREKSLEKVLVKQFYLNFSEKGSYDSLEYWFDTLKDAKIELKKLQKKYPKYFGFIAKPIKVVRKE